MAKQIIIYLIKTNRIADSAKYQLRANNLDLIIT